MLVSWLVIIVLVSVLNICKWFCHNHKLRYHEVIITLVQFWLKFNSLTWNSMKGIVDHNFSFILTWITLNLFPRVIQVQSYLVIYFFSCHTKQIIWISLVANHFKRTAIIGSIDPTKSKPSGRVISIGLS